MPLDALPVSFLFHLDVSVIEVTEISPGPNGNRLVMGAGEGSVAGPAFNGRVVPGPGSEWATLRPDGSLRADVRLVLEADDGARVLMLYQGIGVPAEDAGTRIRTAPLFETGDERYAWLNQVQAVGLGGSGGRGVVYDVYQIL